MMNNNHSQNIESQTIGLSEIKAFGFWVYLMSDLVLFSILFSAFAVVGGNYANGPSPKELFDLPYLLGETTFLLVSSVTMGLGMVAMFRNDQKRLMTSLLITFLLGMGFIVMEVHEFYQIISAGNPPSHSSFLSSFFTLVGMHGTHVAFGLIWIVVMFVQIWKKGLGHGVKSRLYRLSMFWHFLDIVWIGVFTIVYLLGMV